MTFYLSIKINERDPGKSQKRSGFIAELFKKRYGYSVISPIDVVRNRADINFESIAIDRVIAMLGCDAVLVDPFSYDCKIVRRELRVASAMNLRIERTLEYFDATELNAIPA